MQVEATYCEGRLDFVTPLRLKPGPLRVVVEVPDEAIEPEEQVGPLPTEVVARAREMREMLDAIRDAPPPPDDELSEMSETQRERLQAFGFREER